MSNNSTLSNKERVQDFLTKSDFDVCWAEQKKVHSEWTFLWTKEVHQVQTHRIYIIPEGSAKVYLRNSGNTVTMLAGHIYFFPAFSIEKTECLTECFQAFVHFTTDNLYLNTIGYMSDYFCVAIESEEEMKRLLYLREDIEANYLRKDDPGSMLKADGCLRILLSYFFRDFSEWNLQMLRFQDVLEYVNANLSKEISVKDLAEMKNFNVVYFSNLFTRYFGVSPKQYLINQRISFAQRLLSQTEKSVKEVCYEAGFQTESYFIRKFNQILGLTPTQYRKSLLPEKKVNIRHLSAEVKAVDKNKN